MFQDELQTKCQGIFKTFSSVYISMDSPEQDIIVFNIPVMNAQRLKNSNCTIENLPFHCEFSTMKEVVDGVLYHTTQIT